MAESKGWQYREDLPTWEGEEKWQELAEELPEEELEFLEEVAEERFTVSLERRGRSVMSPALLLKNVDELVGSEEGLDTREDVYEVYAEIAGVELPASLKPRKKKKKKGRAKGAKKTRKRTKRKRVKKR